MKNNLWNEIKMFKLYNAEKINNQNIKYIMF